MDLLGVRELTEFLDEHFAEPGDRLFRMERLPVYAVPHQSAELQRWRAGATEPNWTTKRPWLDKLAADRRRGLVSRRVRCFGEPMSDDELRGCHWGYALNGKYEDIRVLHEREHAVPDGLLPQDYWLVNDDVVLPMHYDEHGHFVGAEVAPAAAVAGYCRDRDRAWTAAEPFFTWWARHPELHRPGATWTA